MIAELAPFAPCLRADIGREQDRFGVSLGFGGGQREPGTIVGEKVVGGAGTSGPCRRRLRAQNRCGRSLGMLDLALRGQRRIATVWRLEQQRIKRNTVPKSLLASDSDTSNAEPRRGQCPCRTGLAADDAVIRIPCKSAENETGAGRRKYSMKQLSRASGGTQAARLRCGRQLMHDQATGGLCAGCGRVSGGAGCGAGCLAVWGRRTSIDS
ncbi:hypothetical protein K461DRAFT_266066 [Myriangium duriaei CBS 260.36]|uniref:Uncharacterized protein n=1 Tax=Myriangium duriaei CBS 260.36 TaxID=1168546 RepID=A0A9P4MPH3_9PEZI|nr:hypothetical protein K461DRAFT_266066 [Myriangium duriaei CBS 260.36]